MDSGFGDIFLSEPRKLDVSKLKRKNLPASSLINLAVGGETNLDNLLQSEVCYCNRYKQVYSPVLPVGNMESKVMFLVSQPDDVEGEYGEYLGTNSIGGKLYTAWLDILGYKREDVYLSSVVFCRGLSTSEKSFPMYQCAKLHVEEFKKLTNLEVIFTLGGVPFSLMTGIFGGVGSFIGSYLTVDLFGRDVHIVPLYAPAYASESDIAQEKVFNLLTLISGR